MSQRKHSVLKSVALMLSLNDDRWKTLEGGYRMRFDPRPWLERLASGTENELVLHEFWEELHHQGDVGEASYATVPHLVRIYRQFGVLDWNPYAIVACIDLCRTEPHNPPLPEWLKDDYFQAIQDLSDYGVTQWKQTQTPEDGRGILAVMALAKNLRLHAKFLFNYTDDELLDIESRL
jgi:hypothetical protein